MLMSDLPMVGPDGKMGDQAAKTISVLVADDHPVVRFGVVNLLRAVPGIQVIGEVSSCNLLMAELEKVRPDVLLLDLDLGDVRGSSGVEKIRTAYPLQKILIYTAYDNEACATDVIRTGVQGYLLKGSTVDRLSEAVHAVAQGRFYIDPALAMKVMGRQWAEPEKAVPNWTSLTPKEQLVIRLVVDGKRNREIGEVLGISERTVKYHIGSLFKKLHVSNRTELSKVAVSNGLVGHH